MYTVCMLDNREKIVNLSYYNTYPTTVLKNDSICWGVALMIPLELWDGKLDKEFWNHPAAAWKKQNK